MVKKVAPRPTRPRTAAPAPKTSAGNFYDPGTSPAPEACPTPAPQPPEHPTPRDPNFSSDLRSASDLIDHGLTADTAVVDRAVAFDPEATNASDLASEIERIRAIRKPLGGYNLKLDLPKRRGYHRHWFNDTAGRVDDATNNGWTHVKGKDGKPIRRNVGRGPQQGVQFAFAMEIPDVFWIEDQDHKHQVAQDRVDAIRQRPAVAKAGESKAEDRGKFYNPHETAGDPVKIEKSNPRPL
jgi:hypothetical protein